MSDKYIPPSRRNAAASNKTTVSLDTQNFPTLSNKTPTLPPTKSGISFSALASEWNEKELEDKNERDTREELEKNRAERAEAESRRTFAPLRREYNTPEPYVYAVEEEDDSRALVEKASDDGWKTVDKKARKQLSYEENMERKRKFEEAEARMYDDSSVWNSSEHRSDDWSHRDRRTL